MFKKLKKVTPKALKAYKKLGLMDVVKKSDAEAVEVMIDIFCNEEQMKDLVDVTFDEDFKDVDWDDIDLSQVMGGVADFLSQLHGGTKKQLNWKKSLSKMMMKVLMTILFLTG